jgi:hypothetical protein
MKRSLISLCSLFIFSGLAQAAPPLQISDTGTPGDGQWEINVGITGEKTLSQVKVAFPALDFNYGYGDRIQFKVELPWIFSKEEGEGAKDGLGNSVLGVKWRFLDEERHGISMGTKRAMFPQVSLIKGANGR